jgi:lipoate-protein ligase A
MSSFLCILIERLEFSLGNAKPNISRKTTCSRFELPLFMLGRLDPFMKFLESLTVYQDLTPRPAALNMAIDEALLQTAKVPSIRFYRWQSPALSFGYFGKFADVADYEPERDLVRRWTGGGIVFHGDDLTYSIVIPPSDPVFGESSTSIYEKIHRALADALAKTGQHAQLASPSSPVADRRYSGRACFANPVRADVMIDSRKIAGAAQRRTRGGLLHQGSIQSVNLGNGLAERFARELSEQHGEKLLSRPILERASKIAERKYGSNHWLKLR